ncbi:hypothetical protein SAMN05660297_03592 [Natronincola peptidivorans]|uniref:Uncharacterized protein n=1 Tax=Natronincola peptidivorans TaxID=426128 RepID=A0A1I0HC74_9FIRM|nr:hypothetical protein SAMN05660297_03592 [Natronincola peptidivorans]
MNYAKNRELWEQRVDDFKRSCLTQDVWCVTDERGQGLVW